MTTTHIEDTQELHVLAQQIRKDALTTVYAAGSGHPGGSLSAADILVVLFFNQLHHDPTNPKDTNRDRFILSKGHITPAYYATLAHAGYIPLDELKNFRKLHSRLQGHPDKSKFSLMETSSGSLGQGLSIAAGIAFGLRLDNNPAKVYCLMGDGELQEGQVWESFMTITKYHLHNLIPIIDYNKFQLDGAVADIKNLESLRAKFEAFNLTVFECDGNNISALMQILPAARMASEEKNVIIICHTEKGKGVSFMEHTAEWHGKSPTKEQLDAALIELDK